jgi:hypothetical protein
MSVVVKVQSNGRSQRYNHTDQMSHIPLTFTTTNIKLVSFLHTDAMVITTHIDKWDVTKILVDNGSQDGILFLPAFDQMGYDRK